MARGKLPSFRLPVSSHSSQRNDCFPSKHSCRVLLHLAPSPICPGGQQETLGPEGGGRGKDVSGRSSGLPGNGIPGESERRLQMDGDRGVRGNEGEAGTTYMATPGDPREGLAVITVWKEEGGGGGSPSKTALSVRPQLITTISCRTPSFHRQYHHSEVIAVSMTAMSYWSP